MYTTKRTKFRATNLTLLLVALVSFGFVNSFIFAQTEAAHELTTLLEENCLTCHGAAIQTAGINLSALLEDRPLVKNLDTWRRIIGVLEVGNMPPPGAPQPDDEVRARMLSLLRQNIDGFDYSSIDDPGL